MDFTLPMVPTKGVEPTLSMRDAEHTYNSTMSILRNDLSTINKQAKVITQYQRCSKHLKMASESMRECFLKAHPGSDTVYRLEGDTFKNESAIGDLFKKLWDSLVKFFKRVKSFFFGYEKSVQKYLKSYDDQIKRLEKMQKHFSDAFDEIISYGAVSDGKADFVEWVAKGDYKIEMYTDAVGAAFNGNIVQHGLVFDRISKLVPMIDEYLGYTKSETEKILEFERKNDGISLRNTLGIQISSDPDNPLQSVMAHSTEKSFQTDEAVSEKDFKAIAGLGIYMWDPAATHDFKEFIVDLKTATSKMKLVDGWLKTIKENQKEIEKIMQGEKFDKLPLGTQKSYVDTAANNKNKIAKIQFIIDVIMKTFDVRLTGIEQIGKICDDFFVVEAEKEEKTYKRFF